MLTDLFNNPVSVLFWLVALVIAITVHEFSHALVADRLGDPTPRLMGRLTLNPLAHLDPLGTLMLLIARFGWGKPVPFDPYNLRNPRRDAALISVAGPVSNILMATVSAIVLNVLLSARLSLAGVPFIGLILFVVLNLLHTMVALNVVLAVFNLIPIHPLDGFKIVGGLLPEEQAHQWYELERYGIFFLILLMFPILGRTAPISNLITPIIDAILRILLPGSSII
jgi:Zn-dependent protease